VKRERINVAALDLEERVVQINRVSKVVKGGRRFSFSTVVVVGDGKGHVGVGMGKAAEVPEAIRKGTESAKRNVIRVPLVGTTVPHDVVTKFAATKVMIRPAAPGTGVIAGRGVRPVVEAAGIRDILSKVYGSNNPVNVVKAAFQALSELTSLSEMARRRDMTPQELAARRTRREAVAATVVPVVGAGEEA
jgi:small subunit ribosomal protein S5